MQAVDSLHAVVNARGSARFTVVLVWLLWSLSGVAVCAQDLPKLVEECCDATVRPWWRLQLLLELWRLLFRLLRQLEKRHPHDAVSA